jgi:hypothetical protein
VVSALNYTEVSGNLNALRPLYPWGINHGTHRAGGWVGARAGLKAVQRTKISVPPEFKLRYTGPPDHRLVTALDKLSRLRPK